MYSNALETRDMYVDTRDFQFRVFFVGAQFAVSIKSFDAGLNEKPGSRTDCCSVPTREINSVEDNLNDF